MDRVESIKTEHEKLEGGNRFLQSYASRYPCLSIPSVLCHRKGTLLPGLRNSELTSFLKLDTLANSCRQVKLHRLAPRNQKAKPARQNDRTHHTFDFRATTGDIWLYVRKTLFWRSTITTTTITTIIRGLHRGMGLFVLHFRSALSHMAHIFFKHPSCCIPNPSHLPHTRARKSQYCLPAALLRKPNHTN